MRNNRLSTPYDRHLANITTPIARFNDGRRPRVSISSHARLPSFSNFIRPIVAPATQPLLVDQQTTPMSNPPTLVPVPKEDNSAHPGVASSRANLASSSTQPHTHLVERRNPAPNVERLLVAPHTTSLEERGLLSSSLRFSEADANMPSSRFHQQVNVGHRDSEQVNNEPPLEIFDNHLHHSFHPQQLRESSKKSKDKIHETIKKALEKALNLGNRSTPQSSTHAREALPEIHTGLTPTSSADEAEKEEMVENDITPIMMSQELQPRRRLFGEDGPRALRTARLARFRHKTHANRPENRAHPENSLDDLMQTEAPKDPVLAASLNALALEFANESKASSTIPSFFKKLTGKRRRDADNVIRRPDRASSTVAHQSLFSGTVVARDSPPEVYRRLDTTEVGGSIPGNQRGRIPTVVCPKDGGEIDSNCIDLQNMTTNQSPSIHESDQNFQNDLDFLASVVVSQGVPQHNHNKLRKTPGPQNGSSSVSGQETPTPDDVHRSTQNASGPKTMPPNRLMADNINTAVHSPITSDQGSHGEYRITCQQQTQGGSASVNRASTAPQTATVGQNPSFGGNVHTPQSHKIDEEPKSEASYIDDASPELGQQNQAQNSARNGSIQEAEERVLDTADDIAPARIANSHQLQPDEISPAGPSSFPQQPKANSEAKEMGASSHRKRAGGGGKSSALFKNSNGIVPSAVLVEDEITPVNHTQISQELQTAPSSSTPPGSSKQPKRDGKKTVSRMNDEDVSEITPVPSHLQKSGAHHTRALNQRRDITNEAGSSVHEVTEGDAAPENSGTLEVTTKLPYTFRCDFCGAMFNRRFNLNKHIRNVHYNIRNFKCSVCEERFLQKSHRAAHLLAVHHKLRPFVCHLCTKKFSWLGVLKKHLKAIHKVPIQTAKRARRTRRTGTTQARRTPSPPDKAAPNSENAPHKVSRSDQTLPRASSSGHKR